MYQVLISARNTEIEAMSHGIKQIPSWTAILTHSSLWSVITQIYYRHHGKELTGTGNESRRRE
jgi:hypothetical protein